MVANKMVESLGSQKVKYFGYSLICLVISWISMMFLDKEGFTYYMLTVMSSGLSLGFCLLSLNKSTFAHVVFSAQRLLLIMTGLYFPIIVLRVSSVY